MKNLIKRLKLYIVGKISGWDEFWHKAIPSWDKIELLELGKIKKDLNYYESIAKLSNNAPFIHELGVLQRKYEQRAMQLLALGKYEDAKTNELKSVGIKLVNRIIYDALRKIEEINGT